MLTCPVCDTQNADGSVSCEHCNCAFAVSGGETVVSNSEQTVVATAGDFSASAGIAAARAFSMELAPGSNLNGRYEILSRLGQGGMGTVYKAADHELDRVIALKTIRPDLVTNVSALRRLKQETLLARQIAHRNVIRVFDLGVAGGLRFITMEYVEGQDLRSVLDARRKLPAEEAVAIITQLCQGLAAAHSEDVIHRDLKPQNIILSPDGRVRIMDFGLARSFEDTGTTHTGTILGTPSYMSPEQALGQSGDARSDIFSLGVIFYELLTGELPFPNRTLSEALVSRTQGRARPIESANPSVPGSLARIVMRCLEPRLSDRYPSANEILEDLSSPGRPVTSRFSPPGILGPGAMLGPRYRIEAEAGEGGMGKVYRATDLELHRTVALKIVKPELASREGTLDQLMHEISIASRISHKNVLRIHDLGEANGLRFVSMAWAEGEDLSQLLRRAGPLSEERILQLAREICEGLEAAHEQGITHRDLKPSNILLTADGHACIADFGLAHTLTATPPPLAPKESARAGSPSLSSAGTPRYMSPEQVDGTEVDSRSDIYSLGLILYEMATGKIPFKDESVLQTMTQRLTETPANPKLLNPVLSERLSAAILHCLEREPDKRYASVRQLRQALQMDEAAARALAPSARPGQRRWIYAAAAALCMLAVAAGVLWYRHAKLVEPPVNGKYIAVLPFRPIGSDPNLKYRAEGIADAVSARLLSLNSLHPISSSALERVSLSQPAEKIGQQVGANLLVEGTVQEQGDRIKVDASIYNIEKHHALWSKSYQRDTADLFTLEDDICNDAEHALDVVPTIEEQERAAPAPTRNLVAYDLYLKGRDILKNHRDSINAKTALSLFEQAASQDPGFALAWTGVADADLLLHRTTGDGIYATKALAAAQEARGRNPNLPEVHFALGSAYTATGRNAEAVGEIKHALQLAPNSDDGYIRLGRAYLATGQSESGLAALKKAVELNPYYWFNHKQLGFGYSSVGQIDNALKQFKEQVAQNPGDASGYNNIGAMYLQQAQWKKCIPEFQKAIQIHPAYDEYSNLATAYYELGRYAEAVPIYEKAVAINPNEPRAVRNLAQSYNRAGEKAKAATAYNRAIELLYQRLQVNSQNAGAIGMLARCYADKGDLVRANELITRARDIDGADSDLMYDQALVKSASGRASEALAALKSALENGFPFEYCASDPDLEALRRSPGFESLKKKFGHPAEARRR